MNRRNFIGKLSSLAAAVVLGTQVALGVKPEIIYCTMDSAVGVSATDTMWVIGKDRHSHPFRRKFTCRYDSDDITPIPVEAGETIEGVFFTEIDLSETTISISP